jgi:hypothetical protein
VSRLPSQNEVALKWTDGIQSVAGELTGNNTTNTVWPQPSSNLNLWNSTPGYTGRESTTGGSLPRYLYNTMLLMMLKFYLTFCVTLWWDLWNTECHHQKCHPAEAPTRNMNYNGGNHYQKKQYVTTPPVKDRLCSTAACLKILAFSLSLQLNFFHPCQLAHS